jgi:predicted glycosyltransferase
MTSGVVFRIHNRRGFGHLMRASVLAQEWLRVEPTRPITFLVRAVPPEPFRVPGVSYLRAPDPDCLGVLPDEPAFRQAALLIDDTMLPDAERDLAARWGLPRAFILRQATRERHDRLLQHPAFDSLRAIVLPHARSEFAHPLPDTLITRSHFVGPIAREPEPHKLAPLLQRYQIAADDWFLISTSGGGGFETDRPLFLEIVDQLHRALRQQRDRLKHLVVLGPLSDRELPSQPGMIVVREVPELVHLLPAARGALTGAGYNTVTELMLARTPAVLLSGDRRHDDQHARADRFAEQGFGRSARLTDPAAAVAMASAMLANDQTLAAMCAAMQRHPLPLGNRPAVARLREAIS